MLLPPRVSHDQAEEIAAAHYGVSVVTAVLDVLDEEQLPANAATVGGYLKAELTSVAAASPLLGAVRGAGLYLGADVADPA